MAKFFRTIYEFALGSPQPPADTPIYRNIIFPSVGLTTLLLTLFAMLLFYYGLNYKRSLSTKNNAFWFIFLFVNGIACASIAWYTAVKQGVGEHPYIQYFAFYNFIYASVFFIIISLLGKKWSIHAKTTPTVFPRW